MNGNGPSSFSAVQPASHLTSGSVAGSGQTIESSSWVRVMETRDPVGIHVGIGRVRGEAADDVTVGEFAEGQRHRSSCPLFVLCGRTGAVVAQLSVTTGGGCIQQVQEMQFLLRRQERRFERIARQFAEMFVR